MGEAEGRLALLLEFPSISSKDPAALKAATEIAASILGHDGMPVGKGTNPSFK